MSALPPYYTVSTDSLRHPASVKTTQLYVDWMPFLRGGYHTLLQGRTGAGKTTTLMALLWRLHSRGHRILMRDDGGLDFLYLSEHIPMKVWVPEGCRFTCPTVSEVAEFTEPTEVLDGAYRDETRFHVILYDCYCSTPEPAARFYHSLFQELIYRCMKTPRGDKEPLVFSFDELNDLIQPKGLALTKSHSDIRGMVEYNIRKLRKHRVTLIASTHRFNQIGINVRSQFSYIIIKQSYGYDVYDFISKNLVTVASDTFWSIMRDITTMSPEYAYVFDYKNSYDKVIIPNLPLEQQPSYKIEGVVDPEHGKTYDELDLIVAVLRSRGASFRSIAERTGRSVSTIHRRLEKLRRQPALQHLWRREP